MKKIILRLKAILILILGLFILTGCNNQNDTTYENVENERIISDNADLQKNNNETEEVIDELQVGNYTLKYGTYTGTDSQYDDSGMITAEITILLNKDGTYDLKSSNSDIMESSKGTYVVEKNTYQGIFEEYILNFSSGGIYIVTDNNTLQIPAGSSTKFTYQGN